MRHFTSLCACLVLAAAAAPAALPAQTPTFAPPKQISSGVPGAAYAWLYLYGDFNGNGNSDLITLALGNNNNYYYEFLAGDGTGKFTPTRSVNLGNQEPSLVADFNGDGKDDIVTLEPGSSAGDGVLTILLSSGNGKFTAGYTGSLPRGLDNAIGVIGDFNNDGKSDIAVLATSEYLPGSAKLLVFLNVGDGSFAKTTYDLPATFEAQSAYSNMVTGDFEGNGNQDLAFNFDPAGSLNRCELYVLAGDGTGSFGPAQLKYTFDSLCGVGDGTLFAADLNGDGRTDLLPVIGPKRSSGNTRVPSLLVEKSGKFYWSSALYIDPGGSGFAGFLLTDINGDGKPDLIFVGFNDPALSPFGGVYLGLDDGAFETPHIPFHVPGNNTIPDPFVAAVPLKTGDLPSLIVSNANPTLELLVNTTKK